MTTDWIKFLEAIEEAKIELSCNYSGAWYRGVKSSKYRLYPSLLRPHLTSRRPWRDRERAIFEKRLDFESDPRQTSWEQLVALQHHGNPTRLLDWTEVLGFALFFALQHFDGSKQPAIWVMNPFKLAQNARRSNDKTIGLFHRYSDHDYFDKFINGRELSWPYDAPMPYRPPKLIPRIRAQKGFFTVHGVDRRPVDAIFPTVVRQVRFPASKGALADANTFLSLAGIDELTMFPDEYGFAEQIRARYE